MISFTAPARSTLVMAVLAAPLTFGCATCPESAGALPAPVAQPGAAPAHDSEAASMAIRRTLDDWHRAAAEADEARYFSYFADDAVFLGTDATERWDLVSFRAYAQPHFARGKAWTMRAKKREVVVSPDGRIAWFDEELETEGLGPARGSGVLVWDPRGAFKIVHYNLSLTIPNGRFDAVREALEGPPE